LRHARTLDVGQGAVGLAGEAGTAVVAEQLSMLEAPALSVLFLLLGALGVLDKGLAVGLALWNGVAQFVGWGIGIARRAPLPSIPHARAITCVL